LQLLNDIARFCGFKPEVWLSHHAGGPKNSRSPFC
jgi:hypothetical protein